MSDADSGVRAPASEVVGIVAVWATAALGGGWLGEALAGHITAGFAALLAVLCCAAVVVWAVSSRRSAQERLGAPTGVITAVLVAAVACAGVVVRAEAADRGLLSDLAAEGGRAPMRATVAAEPRPVTGGWHVVLEVSEVAGVATRERAVVTRPRPPVLGRRVTFVASARPVPESSYGVWLARQHAAVILDASGWRDDGTPGWWAARSEDVRERIRTTAVRHLDSRRGGLLVGFVTGDTRLLPEDDAKAMRRAGLSHLTAVSGSNLAIVTAGVLLVVRLLRAPSWARHLAVGVAVAWFAFLTRFEPSVLRAATMVGVLLLAGASGRLRDARHALCLTVLVLIAIDPRLASSVGLVLSASATVGVLIVAPRVRARLPERWHGWAVEVVAVTLGAQIAVLPVLLVAFGEFRLAAVPANLIAVPVAAIASMPTFTASALSLVHPGAGALVFAAAGPGAAAVLGTARLFADVGGTIESARPAGVVGVLAAVVWLLAQRATPRRIGAGAVALAVVVTWSPVVGGHLLPRGFTVTAIDVGQGDAFLVESPAVRILVDGGTDEAAADWLRRNGVRRLDLVVATHPHRDHVGGLPAVLERPGADLLWAAPIDGEPPGGPEVHRTAVRTDTPVRAPVAGQSTALGDVTIEVLNPPVGRPYRHTDSEPNESSYVLRVTHGRARVLLTGDVEATAQATLLEAAGDRLDADVFTVPHHGSATSRPAFLEAVGGHTALIGVGRDNDHGHPAPRVVTLLDELGVRVVRTDRDGTVRVAVTAVGVAERAAATPLASTVRSRQTSSATPPPWTRGSRDERRADQRRRRHVAARRDRSSPRRARRRPARSAGRPVRRHRARAPP